MWGLLIAVLLLLVINPLARLLWTSFQHADTGAFTLENYSAAYGRWRYLEALVYQAVAENMASEQAARRVAMKAATDNASDLIAEFQLIYNKTRQAAITKELSEIVGGAAAISG